MLENEAVNRIHSLRITAETFFKKSLACTKMADVKSFFDLAMQANARADDLESDLKLESCWTYLHFVEYFGYSTEYEIYLEFCIRNRLSPVTEQDLAQALSYKRTSTQSDASIRDMAVQ